MDVVGLCFLGGVVMVFLYCQGYSWSIFSIGIDVMQKGLDLLVKVFENEGVDCIFGVLGEENLDFLELLCGLCIELVFICYEQVVVFMVVMYGRFIGWFGVCFVMLGFGVLNFLIGVVYVYFGVWLMIFIIGQKVVMSVKQVWFQIVDIVVLMKLFMKMICQIVSLVFILVMVCDVFCVVMEDCFGFVYLELLEDIVGEEVEDVVVILVYLLECFIVLLVVFDCVEVVIFVVRWLLVMIGVVCSWLWLVEVLFVFVVCMCLLFFNMQMGKGVVIGGFNLYVGMVVFLEGDYVYEVIVWVDLIIVIGYDIVEKLLFLMKSSGGFKVIYISFQFVMVEQVYYLDIEVLGDIGVLVDVLVGWLEGCLFIDEGMVDL